MAKIKTGCYVLSHLKASNKDMNLHSDSNNDQCSGKNRLLLVFNLSSSVFVKSFLKTFICLDYPRRRLWSVSTHLCGWTSIGEGAENACIRKIRWSVNDSETGEVERDTTRMRKTSPRWFTGLTAGFREVLDTLAGQASALLRWE